MQIRKLLTSLSIALAMGLLCTTQSCHDRYDEGSEEGHYDTVQQNRSSDRTMANQQHDGTLPPITDTTATVDSSMVK